MKISLRAAVYSILAVGGTLAATAANAAIDLPSSGSSELLFFVTDASKGLTYTEVLPQTINGSAPVWTSAQAAAGGGTVGQINVVNNLTNSFTYNAGANTALQSFITANQADGLTWGIYAGSVPTSGFNKPGGNMALITAVDPTGISLYNISGTNLTAALGGNSLEHDVNALNAGTFDAFGGTANGVIGTAASGAANLDFYGTGAQVAGATIGGSGAHLYGLTASGSAVANVLAYDLGSITFNGTTLSFTANKSGGGTQAPLPAAVWLLGSGLLGLAGVGRRRKTTAV